MSVKKFRKGAHFTRDLFREERPDIVVTITEPKRGRDAELIAKRNELLFARYVYYNVNFRNHKTEWMFEQLMEEFFISTDTIANILMENEAEVLRVKKAFDIKEAAKRWWKINWSTKIQN